MKTTLLSFILIFVFFNGMAQSEISVPDLPPVITRISVEEESRQMQRNLLLNENQYHKIKEINQDRREKIDAITSMFPHEPEKRDKKISELELQYDHEFAAVLDKRQMAEYLELHGRGDLTTFKSQDSYKSVAVQEKKPEGPSFNDQIHSIIEKATAPADTSKLASEEILQTDSLGLQESIYDGNPKATNFTSSSAKTAKVNEKQLQVAEKQQAKVVSNDSIMTPAKIAGKPNPAEITDSASQQNKGKTALENSNPNIAKPDSLEKGVSATFEH
jgi:hypothetical protein